MFRATHKQGLRPLALTEQGTYEMKAHKPTLNCTVEDLDSMSELVLFPLPQKKETK